MEGLVGVRHFSRMLSLLSHVGTEVRSISGTFGEDTDLVTKLVTACVEGFQGKKLGPESVLTVTKHFPGWPRDGGQRPAQRIRQVDDLRTPLLVP